MIKKIIIAGVSVFMASGLFAGGIKKELDVQSFIKELKAVQEEINRSNTPKKDINSKIQNITSQNRLKRVVANMHSEDIIKIKLQSSLSYLYAFEKKLKKQRDVLSYIPFYTYYKIGDKQFVKVYKNDIVTKSKEIANLDKSIFDVNKIYSMVFKISKLKKELLLSNKIDSIIMSANNLRNNYNSISSIGQNNQNESQFCSLHKRCYGYKILNIKDNNVQLDF